jgi:hypothetical protein
MRSLVLVLLAAGCCVAGLALSPAEYAAVRGKTVVAPLRAEQPAAAQFPTMAGLHVELTGTVRDVDPAQGAPTFMLQTDGGDVVLITSGVDPLIASGQHVRVLARIPDKGLALQGKAVMAEAAPAPPAPAAAVPAKAAAKPAPQTAPAPKATVGSYVATIRKIAPWTSKALATQIVTIVLERAQHHGVDPRLVLALLAQESGFNPRAVSRVGAMGLGQLMPGTAQQLGVRRPFDIRQNIDGTVRYLAMLLRTFRGNISYVLSAYNAGPGSVVRYGGIPPFRETQHYVKTISSHYRAMRSTLL